MLASSSGTIKLLDVASRKELGNFDGHSLSFRSVAFNSDGTVLTDGNYDGANITAD
jgi:WD40 repeat protein